MGTSSSTTVRAFDGHVPAFRQIADQLRGLLERILAAGYRGGAAKFVDVQLQPLQLSRRRFHHELGPGHGADNAGVTTQEQ